jgi:hypothetical protein
VNRQTDKVPSSASSSKRELLARLLLERSERAVSEPLSYGQRALWEREVRAPGSAVNTEAFSWRHHGPFDLPGLRADCVKLLTRHPCLRTTYGLHAGEPVQRFHDAMVPVFEVVDAAGWSPEQLRRRVSADAHRGWDLKEGPVFHVSLYRRSSQEIILLTRIHHLAIDLWSMGIVLEDLQVLHLARQLGVNPQLAPLPAHYRDFVRWQDELVKGPEGERQWDFWRRQLAGVVSGLPLPTDRPRPAVPLYRGATVPLQLEEDLTQRLRALAREEQTTLFVVLLSALQVTLGRFTGQEDVLVGSRAAGRSRPEFEGLVGYFANPIALRADLSGNPSYRSLLRQVRQTVQGVLSHQDYPFSLLQSRLAAPPAPGRPPLGNVVFVLQKPHRAGGEAHQHGAATFGIPSQVEAGANVVLGRNRLELFPVDLEVARYDLELEMVEAGGSAIGWLRYSLDLFTAATATALLRDFTAVLGALVSDPDRRLADLPVAPAATRAQGPEQSAAVPVSGTLAG